MPLTQSKYPRKQRGVMLLEALLGMGLFSIGILALIAMQGTALSSSSDAKYRTDAAFAANQLINTVWNDRANVSNYAWDGTGTAPSALTSWNTALSTTIPGASIDTATTPVVTVSTGPAYSTVVIKVRWRLPKSTDVRVFTTSTYPTNP
jgi:type IV pilus assembly protein PilV